MAALASLSVGLLVFSWDAHSDFWLRGPGKKAWSPGEETMPFSEAADNPKISQPDPGSRWTYLLVGLASRLWVASCGGGLGGRS